MMGDQRSNEDELSGPAGDIGSQNPDETTIDDLSEEDGDFSDDIDEDDPNKAEQLTRAGRDMDPDEGAD